MSKYRIKASADALYDEKENIVFDFIGAGI